MLLFVLLLVGKPVDQFDNVHCVPTLFVYHKQHEKEKKRREDRQRRIDKRRQIAEEVEHDKENRRMVEEHEKESQKMAVEGSLLLRDSLKVDAAT